MARKHKERNFNLFDIEEDILNNGPAEEKPKVEEQAENQFSFFEQTEEPLSENTDLLEEDVAFEEQVSTDTETVDEEITTVSEEETADDSANTTESFPPLFAENDYAENLLDMAEKTSEVEFSVESEFSEEASEEIVPVEINLDSIEDESDPEDSDKSENADSNEIPSFSVSEEEEPVIKPKKKGFFLFRKNKKAPVVEEMNSTEFEVSAVSASDDSVSESEEEILPDEGSADILSEEQDVNISSEATVSSVFDSDYYSDIAEAEPTQEVSTLADAPDADSMVSILEEDVSTEITADENDIEISKATVKKTLSEKISAQQYKTFEEIKDISVMDKFETPYVYNGEKGEHVRYRLSLPNDKDTKKLRKRREIVSYVITIAVALIVAFLLRSFVLVFATVDGPSMEPTLYTKERVLVTRYSYYFSEIQHGDIIVCDFPSKLFQDHYIKRVIAVGGETVMVKNGVVYVNDKALSEDYIKAAPEEDMDPVFVPEGYVFVMGDNRNNSTDSRKSYIGPIKKKLVIGKARVVLWPFSKIGSLE